MPSYNGREDYGQMPNDSIDISFFGRTKQSKYWIGVDEDLYYISDQIFNDVDPLTLFPDMYEGVEFQLVDFKNLVWECEIYTTNESEWEDGNTYILELFFTILPRDDWLMKCLYLSPKEFDYKSHPFMDTFETDFTLYGNVYSQLQDIAEEAIEIFENSPESDWEEYTDYDRYSGDPYGRSGRFLGSITHFYVPFFIEGKGDGEEESPYRLYRIQ